MCSTYARGGGAGVARRAVVVQRQTRQPSMDRGLGHEGGAAGVLCQQHLLCSVERVIQQGQQLQVQGARNTGFS